MVGAEGRDKKWVNKAALVCSSSSMSLSAMVYSPCHGHQHACNCDGSLIFAFSLMLAFSRVYCGVHYPLDVVVGAMVGILNGALVLKVKV